MMRPLPSLRLVMGAAAASLLLAPAAAVAATAATATDAQATDAATSCDDLLVTFTRDAITGDDRAVAITAQSIEYGVPGWERVGWQSADSTTLSAVLATDRRGEVHHLGTQATGIAEQVTSLAFCGTAADRPDTDTDTDDRDGDDGAYSDADADEGHTDDDPEVVVEPPADPEERGKGASDTGDTAPATGVQERVDAAANLDDAPTGSAGEAETQAPDDNDNDEQATAIAPAQAPTAPPETGSDAGADPIEPADAGDGDDEVEVLGVRIVATPEGEDDPADDDAVAQDGDEGTAGSTDTQPVLAATSPGTYRGLLDSAWLLAAAIAAGIAAGASVIRFRSSAAATTEASSVGTDATRTTTTTTRDASDTTSSTGQQGGNHR